MARTPMHLWSRLAKQLDLSDNIDPTVDDVLPEPEKLVYLTTSLNSK